MTNEFSTESKPVVCLGVFDGVHRGHQALLAFGRQIAHQYSEPLVAVTFDPHPLQIVDPSRAPRMLTTLDQRIALLQQFGADRVEVLEFSTDMSHMDSDEFFHSILQKHLHVRHIVVGENFTFGHRARGNVDTLRTLGLDAGIGVSQVPLTTDSVPISSTRIRAALDQGEIRLASELLGHPFRLSGVVVMGDQRGRDLGYPTANLDWPTFVLIPQDGVYAGFVHTESATFPAAISVGTNPQFEGSSQRIEAYVLDRTDLDLYGHRVEFEFVALVRPQKVFANLDGYLQQMTVDVERVRQELEG